MLLNGLLDQLPYAPPKQFNRWGSDHLGKFKRKRKAEKKRRRGNTIAKASRRRNHAR